VAAIDSDFWRDRRVLVTGHTGFKGAWLSLWLQSLGAKLTGLAGGPPSEPSLYRLARVGERMDERAVDVRDAAAVREAIDEARPEIVLHLAAQPLVRRSLREPALTFDVNVMGTVNVLDALRDRKEALQSVVVVTSDKCYENPPGATHSFKEGDPLGGHDPYSASKAAAEIVVGAYRDSFFSDDGAAGVASARAGNVIGGGDWGEDRLLADAVRAMESGSVLRVRNPEAVRPWQHVLNPLAGYLLLARRAAESPSVAGAFNFGPPAGDARSVGSIVERLSELSEGRLRWERDGAANPPEAGHLALDSSLARERLGWRPSLDLDGGLGLLVDWHRALAAGEDMRAVTLAQIEAAGEA
jgi:CDP-glucose 4,6-dehydratase